MHKTLDKTLSFIKKRERKKKSPIFSNHRCTLVVYYYKSVLVIIVGGIVAPHLIVSPLRAVDKMHFVIAIDPLHSVLMRKWSDFHSCSVIRIKSMNHAVKSMISSPRSPIPVWIVAAKFIFHAHPCSFLVFPRWELTETRKQIPRYIFRRRCGVLIRVVCERMLRRI